MWRRRGHPIDREIATAIPENAGAGGVRHSKRDRFAGGAPGFLARDDEELRDASSRAKSTTVQAAVVSLRIRAGPAQTASTEATPTSGDGRIIAPVVIGGLVEWHDLNWHMRDGV